MTTLQNQVIAIMEQSDPSVIINLADETGIYYSCDGGDGYIEPSEYQQIINN